MAQYKVLAKCFHGNLLREPGDVVEADESPGKHFELVGEKPEVKVKVKVKGKGKGKVETLANLAEQPGPDNPETLAGMTGSPGKDFL